MSWRVAHLNTAVIFRTRGSVTSSIAFVQSIRTPARPDRSQRASRCRVCNSSTSLWSPSSTRSSLRTRARPVDSAEECGKLIRRDAAIGAPPIRTALNTRHQTHKRDHVLRHRLRAAGCARRHALARQEQAIDVSPFLQRVTRRMDLCRACQRRLRKRLRVRWQTRTGQRRGDAGRPYGRIVSGRRRGLLP